MKYSFIIIFEPLTFSFILSVFKKLPQMAYYILGMAVVTGWGRLAENGTSPQVLQHLTLPLMEKYICKDKYRRIGYSRYTHNCQICAASSRGGKDACQVSTWLIKNEGSEKILF